jgi:hypothetical protein
MVRPEQLLEFLQTYLCEQLDGHKENRATKGREVSWEPDLPSATIIPTTSTFVEGLHFINKNMKTDHANRLILLIATTALVGSCAVCGEEQLLEEKSPNGRFVVTVYQRNCGATTSYVTHANLRRVGDEIRADYAGTLTDGEILTARGPTRVVPVWSGTETLNLHVDQQHLIKCSESLYGVQISCVKAAGPSR